MIDLSSPVGGSYNLPSLPDVSIHKIYDLFQKFYVNLNFVKSMGLLDYRLFVCFKSYLYPLEIL